MGAPFEDKVVAYIGQHRPLKLVALGVAAVGILSSAWKTLQPIVDWARPPMYRMFGASLDQKEKERLACAYFLGGAVWDIHRDSESKDEDLAALFTQHYQARALQCHATLGLPYSELLKISTNDGPQSVKKLQEAIHLSIVAVDGHLRATDHLALSLFQFSFEVSQLEMTLMRRRMTDPRAMGSATLDQTDIKTLQDAQAAYSKAAKLCPCRFPALRWSTETGQELLESSLRADGEMADFLGVKY